jgi:hypothetical protein
VEAVKSCLETLHREIAVHGFEVSGRCSAAIFEG